jgi:sugar lactone lactonase YvrE
MLRVTVLASCAALLCATGASSSVSLPLSSFSELAVNPRELFMTGGLAGLSTHEDVLVRRLEAMATTRTDAELREQAKVLFRLYKALNARAVAAMGATESEQFEVFYKTVFQQILARVNASRAPAAGTTPSTGTGGTSPSTGTGGSPSTGTGGSPSTGAGGSPSTGTGGSPSTGAGGSPSTGAGGSPSTGAGGSPATGTGGSPSTGAGGSPATGTGGSPSTGTSTGTGGSPSTGTSTGTGGSPSTGTGGSPSTGTGGSPSTGTGGSPTTSTGGTAGGNSGYAASTPTEVAEGLAFFTQVYDKDLAKNVRALQDNTQNIEAIVQSSKETSGSDPASAFQAPTVLEPVDNGPTSLSRRLADGSSADVKVLFCDVSGNAIWSWTATPPPDADMKTINSTTQTTRIQPKLCEAAKVEVKVTAYQSGCSRQNHPEGCDKVYWKGCGGLTVNRASNRIVVARTGGRSLGLLYYKSVSDSCQGRVIDAIKTYKGKKFNSISYAEYAPSGNLYFTDSPFGLATGPADFEGDILDKSPLRELPFNGVFLLKNDSMKVDLVDCAMDRPNKIAFSPKGDLMYITNSRKGNSYVKQFTLKTDGSIESSKTFFNFTAKPELQTDEGFADGIKTDKDGNIYVAVHKGVYILSPKGELIGTLQSTQAVSGIALGGGRMFLSGSFGVVAQTSGILPSAPLPSAKTECN